MKYLLPFLSALLISAPSLANADTAELTEQQANGKQLAQTHCARCHNISLSGESPLPAAPVFRSFNEKWPLNYLEEALAEGIVTGHTDMPEFQFEPEQLSQFLAYIEALKTSQTPKN